jgi:hypothetical protein
VYFVHVSCSVADPDPGSGAFLTPGPGSWIWNRFFMKFVATKKVMTKNFFFTPLFCAVFGIKDPGWVKIRIRDKHPGSATLVS